MKNVLRSLVVSALIGSAASAFAAVPIGDNAQLFFTGNIGLRADDNVLLAPDDAAENDTIFEVTPGLDLVFGEGAAVRGTLAVSESFTRYSDNDHLDTELFSGVFSSRYEESKTKLKVQGGYREIAQNSFGLRSTTSLVRRNISSAGADVEVEATVKNSIGVAANYEKTDYRTPGFVDNKMFTVPVNFFWKFTSKVDLSAGLRYRSTDVQTGNDSDDYFYNVGARGEFTPKLTGRVNIGFNQRNVSGGSDENQLGIDSSFSYAYSPKTSFQFGVGNDFGTNGFGVSQKDFSINSSVLSKIANDWTVNGGLSYRTLATGGSKDKYWEGQAGVGYVMNSNVTFNAGYVHRTNNGASPGGDFKNNVFSIAANLRY